MRAPRARACSSSSSTSTAAASAITNPSRSRSNGRDADAGSSFRVESARMAANPATETGVTGASAPPHTMTSARPSLIASSASPIAMLDAAMAPANDAVATIQGILDAFDLGPIEDELVALHQAVTEDVAALSPAALLGPVLEEADQVIARLAGFDPLAPVREVIDASRA